MVTKIACAQFKCKVGDKTANIRKMESFVEKIKTIEDDVDLIVFPECCITGYECGHRFKDLAETFPDGGSLLKVAEMAKKWDTHIVFGYPEKESDGSVYNAAALVDNQGKLLGNYRKTHLVEGIDTEFFKRGNDYFVFDTAIGKIGIIICWDSAFPESARILALKGAEIIVIPAAWEYPYDRDWDLCISARSFDNVSYVAACNRVGTDEETTYFGKSKIIGPLGRTIAEASNQEEFIVAAVDLDELAHYRDGYYVLLKDRRPETYHMITERN